MKKLFFAVLIVVTSSWSHAQIITTVAGGGSTFADNIPATDARLDVPRCLTFDHSGNMYIGDVATYKIRKVNTAGIVTTVAGNGTEGYSGDNGPANAAEIEKLYWIASDNDGNIYFGDLVHHVVRKVDAAGMISTFAGSGAAGFSGNGGPATAANLNGPAGITVDSHGNVFIADYHNNVIRKVDASGIISTFAGTGIADNTGDNGPAINAAITPTDLAIDGADNLFLYCNPVIRKIDASGIITTVAGGGTVPVTDGGPATGVALNPVGGMAADHTGNIYISHPAIQRLRRINTVGAIRAFAGTGYISSGGYGDFSGDYGPALLARLSIPSGVTIGTDGSVYFADSYNFRIRKITIDPNSVPAITNNTGSPRVFPNPSTAAFTISLLELIRTVQITDAMGRVVATRNLEGSKTEMVTFNEDNALPAGVYYIQVTTATGKYNDRVVVQ